LAISSTPAFRFKGNEMSDRSWFYAPQGQQQGPFPEAQFRSLIARGTVTPDTLVWTDGMAGWQRAGDIPGLAPGAASRPPAAVPQPGCGARCCGLACVFIIPIPWMLRWYSQWYVSQFELVERTA
jgi:hypothetical protein